MDRDDVNYEKKWAEQRAKRGFSDMDASEIDTWFMKVMPEMLKQFRRNSQSYPSCFITDPEHPEDTWEEDSAKWDKVLERMIFLLNEMDEDKCSLKNPYAEEYYRITFDFRQKYGAFGEKAKTPEMLAEEEGEPGVRMCFATDFPNLYPTARKVHEDYFDYEKKIEGYREDCKNKFFELFSKYFWALWN